MNVIPYSQQYGPLSKQQIIMPQTNIIPQQITNPSPLGGIEFVYVEDPMLELANCTSVIIKQEPEFFEAITGCETANRYHIFGKSPMGFKYLFKCKEKSSCFMRNFCPSGQRAFDMEITHINSANMINPEFIKSFANAFKPLKCTICCFCRPELNVVLNEGNGIIGSVKSVFSFCDPNFEVFDENKKLRFIVTANCCQTGLLCANKFFGKMSEVDFNILNPENVNQIIGKIIKKSASFSEMVTDADSYIINFPTIANTKEKLLIIALGLLIDYQYFETDSSDEKKKRKKNRGPSYHY